MVNKRVLVVDDSPTNRQALSDLLQREGYDVTTAVDGEDALAKIAADPPPLVVLDIILPKMNGYQVLRQLRTDRETRHIKVILVSSKNQESDRFWVASRSDPSSPAVSFDRRELAPAKLEALIDRDRRDAVDRLGSNELGAGVEEL